MHLFSPSFLSHQRCVRKVLDLVKEIEGKRAASNDQVISSVLKTFANRRRKYMDDKKASTFMQAHPADSQEMRDHASSTKYKIKANRRNGRSQVVRTKRTKRMNVRATDCMFSLSYLTIVCFSSLAIGHLCSL